MRILKGTEGVSLWQESLPVGVAFLGHGRSPYLGKTEQGWRAWARVLPLGGGGPMAVEVVEQEAKEAAERLSLEVGFLLRPLAKS